MLSASDEKRGLRDRWKAKFPSDEATRGRLSVGVCRHIQGNPVFKRAARIALFAPRTGEIDLTTLWTLRPKACAFPKVAGKQMLFFSVDSLTLLAPGFAKILEPPPADAKQVHEWSANDLILVPALCFDRTGARLGSGLGFYDRFLQGLNPRPHLWGVCFDEQLSSVPLPQEDHDVRMERICTPSGLLETGAASP